MLRMCLRGSVPLALRAGGIRTCGICNEIPAPCACPAAALPGNKFQNSEWRTGLLFLPRGAAVCSLPFLAKSHTMISECPASGRHMHAPQARFVGLRPRLRLPLYPRSSWANQKTVPGPHAGTGKEHHPAQPRTPQKQNDSCLWQHEA